MREALKAALLAHLVLPPKPGVDGKAGGPGAAGLSVKGDPGEPGESIKGDPGDPGPAGKDGVGKPGRDGRNGTNGKDGKPGPKGDKGDPGPPGKDGRDGRDGQSVRGGGSSGGSSLAVTDEGVSLDTAVSSIDVVGDALTATNVGHAVTLTSTGIPQGGPLTTQLDADNNGIANVATVTGVNPELGGGPGGMTFSGAGVEFFGADDDDNSPGRILVGNANGSDGDVTITAKRIIAPGMVTADPSLSNAWWLDQGHVAVSGATPLGTAAFAARSAHVADGSTVNQLRDALVAAGLMDP